MAVIERDAEIAALDANLSYLREVPPILRAAATANDGIMQVKQKYPTYTGTGLVDYSTPTFFTNCRP